MNKPFTSKHCAPINYGSPLNQGFQDEAKKTNSMMSPYDKLTERQKDSLVTEVRRYNIKKHKDPDYQSYYVPKFDVTVDPESGVLLGGGNKDDKPILPNKK